MFKLSLAVFTYLFTYGCCANSVESPIENNEQSPDEETEVTIEVPSKDEGDDEMVNVTNVGDEDNLGEKDFQVNQLATLEEKPAKNYRAEELKEEGGNSHFLSSFLCYFAFINFHIDLENRPGVKRYSLRPLALTLSSK